MQDLKQLKQIKSPCVSICKYNKNNYCVGCKRYMNEIFDWFDYSDEMRESIMSDLDNRDIDNPD
ncbi:MAG: DUF1289 domain-containing protein [Gammaproteobacteria bacterium]|jgi:hypothetical protein|nr:DUF1289 domain-containing protein [Gammaproteobacteria bacterium]